MVILESGEDNNSNFTYYQVVDKQQMGSSCVTQHAAWEQFEFNVHEIPQCNPVFKRSVEFLSNLPFMGLSILREKRRGSAVMSNSSKTLWSLCMCETFSVTALILAFWLWTCFLSRVWKVQDTVRWLHSVWNASRTKTSVSVACKGNQNILKKLFCMLWKFPFISVLVT